MRSLIIRNHTTEDKQQTTEEFVSITLLGIELFSRHETRYSIKSHGLTTTRILGITVWTREYNAANFARRYSSCSAVCHYIRRTKNGKATHFDNCKDNKKQATTGAEAEVLADS